MKFFNVLLITISVLYFYLFNPCSKCFKLKVTTRYNLFLKTTTKSTASPVPEIIAPGVLAFGWGLRTPNLREEEAVGGRG